MIELAIGTAQFGQNYGICNTHGAVEGGTAFSIVDTALEHSINFFDTASIYGESEKILGQALQKIQKPYQANIITKYYANSKNPEALYREFDKSSNRIGTDRIYGLLVHNADALLGDCGAKIWRILKNIQKMHNIPKVGVSVYTPQDFIEIISQYDPALVQVPCNFLDQRFLQTDIQSLKQERGIEFHARSLFLQGLLLKPSKQLPDYFQTKKESFIKAERVLNQSSLSHIELCLGFAYWAQDNNLIDRWVIGVDTDTHLKEIAQSFKDIKSKLHFQSHDFRSLATNDLDIIDPRRWRKDND